MLLGSRLPRGVRSGRESNAIANARTPVMNRLYATQAHTELAASGEAVGLPPGVMTTYERSADGTVTYAGLPLLHAGKSLWCKGSYALTPSSPTRPPSSRAR